MKADRRALRFICKGSALVGIIDVPERPLPRGMLVLSGNSQYRVGGHRQFALLARTLAARGIPVLRFDQRGTGDSGGDPRSFDSAEDDIGAAIKEFFMQMPDMTEIVIWGLSDAAAAAAFYADADERVRGLVLLNPRVRKYDGAERASLRHYYLPRLGELGFWKKVATGNLDFAASAAALRRNLRLAAKDRGASLAQRVLASLACFRGPVLVILGGDDPGAREFAALMAGHELRCRRVDIATADRSFAGRAWRDEVAQVSANWIMSW